jgi:succinate dehydrogenase / fumarate reductase cytochrome b subunit
MSWLTSFWRSSIGGKVTMAVTGLMLFGFLVSHLVGNLLLLQAPGPDGIQPINAYAKWLHDLGPMLWVMRIGLLAVFVLHVVTAIRLSRANKAARPVAYYKPNTVQANMASRSMLLSGFSVLAFLVYHLLHFTFEVEAITPAFDRDVMIDNENAKNVYEMVTKSFANPATVIAYVAFQAVLFLHLSHGVQSMAQTVGVHHARYTPMIKTVAFLVALAIAGGNVLLSLSVMLGLTGGSQ